MTFWKYVEDQRGAMTFWLLMWSIIFIAFAGLAIDVANLYRTRAMLQATADAASHAGAVAIKLGGSPVTAASDVTAVNMPNTTTKGHSVVSADDITLGTWDSQTRKFTPGGGPTNAVMVVANRTEATSNSLDTFLLRILDFDTWNVSAVAIATAMEPEACDGDFPNAIVAGGQIIFTSGNKFGGVLCVHGEHGVVGKQGNITLDESVQFTMPYATPASKDGDGQWDVMSCSYQPDPSVDPIPGCNVDSGNQMPWDAEPERIQRIVDAVFNAPAVQSTYDNLADFGGAVDPFGFVAAQGLGKYRNVTHGGNANTAYNALEADHLAGYTHFKIDCSGTDSFAVPQGVVLKDATIVTDCEFSFPGTATVDNLTVLSTSDTGMVTRDEDTLEYVSTNVSGNGKSSNAIFFAGQPGTVLDPLVACTAQVSSLRLYAPGAVNFAASADFSKVEIFSGGDVSFAARPTSTTTVNIYAWGDVDWTAGSVFTPCSPTAGPGSPFPRTLAVNIVL